MSDNAIANPTASTDSMAMMGQKVNKRHLKFGFAALAALALIIGLSAGLTKKNKAKTNVSASQSNKSVGAYSAVDDISDKECSSSVSTKPPTMPPTKPPPKFLQAVLGNYPGYTFPKADFKMSGSVRVTFPNSNSLRLEYDFNGFYPKTDYGVRIHEGTSCDDVDGPYYKGVADPWTVTGITDVMYGRVMGEFEVTSGYDTLAENVGHAVVIYSSETYVGCGILEGKTGDPPTRRLQEVSSSSSSSKSGKGEKGVSSSPAEGSKSSKDSKSSKGSKSCYDKCKSGKSGSSSSFKDAKPTVKPSNAPSTSNEPTTDSFSSTKSSKSGDSKGSKSSSPSACSSSPTNKPTKSPTPKPVAAIPVNTPMPTYKVTEGSTPTVSTEATSEGTTAGRTTAAEDTSA